MTIALYAIVEIISIVFMALAQKAKKKEAKNKVRMKIRISIIFLIFSMIPFLLLLWFRDISVGTDYEMYSNVYLKILDGTLSARESEWIGNGFKYICMGLSFFFGSNYKVAFAIINTITVYLIYKTIFEHSESPWMSLSILFAFCLHFQIFNQFRQMLAIAICFYNIKYLKNQNWKAYMLITLLAVTIHKTALIMIPVYFISNIKVTKKTCSIYMTVAVVLYFMFGIVISLFSNTYYGQMYFGNKYDVETSSTVLNFIVRLTLLIVSMAYYKPIMEKDEDNIYLFNLVIYCTILQVLAMKSYIFARLTTYFYIFYTLLIPQVVNVMFKKKNNRYIGLYVLIMVLLMYKYVYYNSSSGAVGSGYDVYKTFLIN